MGHFEFSIHKKNVIIKISVIVITINSISSLMIINRFLMVFSVVVLLILLLFLDGLFVKFLKFRVLIKIMLI